MLAGHRNLLKALALLRNNKSTSRNCNTSLNLNSSWRCGATRGGALITTKMGQHTVTTSGGGGSGSDNDNEISSPSAVAREAVEDRERLPPNPQDAIRLEKSRIGKELSFVSRLNCMTGKVEWVELPDEYDYHQEIARSAYADMLHDHDRNMRYFEALRYEIARLKSEGQPAHVLDIGTGTGLLSMMAVVAGADSVIACDAFTSMLDCARKVVKRNGFADKIKLIPKRSTELVVGVDLPYRCNILVTEVFDTELIGEGAISTFNHAHRELLTDPAVVIPASSTVYAQVVSSPEVEKWNALPKQLDITPSISIRFPESASRCSGIPSVQDLQLDAIQRDEFTPVSPPLPIFTFDFTSATPPIPKYRSRNLTFKSECEGHANGVFLWWDLDMDRSGKNVLSCQPSYVKHGGPSWFASCPPQNAAWRDHWMHSVYFVPRSEPVKTGEDVVLCSAHDEYSFWFDVVNERRSSNVQFPDRHPVCECGIHTMIPRSQLYMMNDREKYEVFVDVFKEAVVPGETVCVCISDVSVLPVILARLGAKKVFVVESCEEHEHLCQEIVDANRDDEYSIVRNKIHVVKGMDNLNRDLLGDMKIDLVAADPYFQVAVYPWQTLQYVYSLQALDKSLLSPSVRLTPHIAVITIIAVNFTHLWKIQAPVGVAAHQFDLTDFDELIKTSSSISDGPVDAQPLWEYESTATSYPVSIMTFDASKKQERQRVLGELKLHGTTNGIAIWMDWMTQDGKTILSSTGPKRDSGCSVPPVKPGDKIVWERWCKQGVYFVDNKTDSIEYETTFDDSTGEISFNFS